RSRDRAGSPRCRRYHRPEEIPRPARHHSFGFSQSPGTMTRSHFLGTGMAVPDHVVTNDDLSAVMDTTDHWIRTRTGIQERRWVRQGETGADLALAASGGALDMSCVAPGDVDAIVYATATPDHFAPGNVVFRQRMLGAGPIP